MCQVGDTLFQSTLPVRGVTKNHVNYWFILNIADGLYDRTDFKMPNAAKKKKPTQRR